MRQLLRDIDLLLRGGYTQSADLRLGKVTIPIRSLVLAGLLLGCVYGLFMGIYGATRPVNGSVAQLVATTFKVPLLFLLTLVVTLPSLYVLSALAGSRLRFQGTLGLLLAAVAINLALLASLGPVVGFFTLSTQSYPFMVLLNVTFFAFSGVVGLVFLRRALRHVFAGAGDRGNSAALQGPNLPLRSPIQAHRGDLGEQVFRGWLVVYGIVGAQMGWILRPFIGTSELPFEWFRARESDFLSGVLNALRQLFS
jgi:hypothetical protein